MLCANILGDLTFEPPALPPGSDPARAQSRHHFFDLFLAADRRTERQEVRTRGRPSVNRECLNSAAFLEHRHSCLSPRVVLAAYDRAAGRSARLKVSSVLLTRKPER